MNKEFVTSKGGLVRFTSTGLTHTPGKGFYSGQIAETGVMPVAEVKRGRGRPRKDTSENGASFDFSAFVPPRVPKWNGASRVYINKGE